MNVGEDARSLSHQLQLPEAKYMVTFQAYAVPVPFQGEYAEVLTMLFKHLTQTSQMLIR